MVARAKLPDQMSIEEFLAWDPADGRRWQLVDGEPQAMAPGNTLHAFLQGELGRLLGNHLLAQGLPGNLLVTPGVIPAMMSARNMRVPDLAVSCSPLGPNQAAAKDPVLIVEILSPSNRAETWSNVWAYTAIPSVQEILVLRTDRVGGDLLRRRENGTWPDQPAILEQTLELKTVNFRIHMAELYARMPVVGPA
jgi:Uma2 family endonuclease